MNQTVLDALRTRRSVRKFKSEQIKPEELEAVLYTGIYAPTAKGAQSPIIIAVQDKAERDAVARLNASFTNAPESDPYYGAPTVLLILAPREAKLGVEDGSAVTTTLLNAAWAAGLGSCWINRPQDMFETEEGKAMLRRWGVEGDYKGVASVALGYADCPPPEPKHRKSDYIRII